GGIPKDGPSAGITLATALISAFTGIAVNREIAMTVEITLRGKILPVGGIKEKVLSARRAGIRTIIMPEKNKKDLSELKDGHIQAMNFIFVSDFKDAINAALIKKIF
ncbi:MAG: endopeptidase La, partial [Candidatus Aminicenantes bacterium]|nr:endopeptidase La [Candidatus Aminicenantes bacterium]